MPPVFLKRVETDSRVRTNSPGKGWFSFTLTADADLHDALEWLNSSYDAAAKKARR